MYTHTRKHTQTHAIYTQNSHTDTRNTPATHTHEHTVRQHDLGRDVLHLVNVIQIQVLEKQEKEVRDAFDHNAVLSSDLPLPLRHLQWRQ
eukprot:m.1212302 g.1212302  ORF g.1212302 m.1212302 type:complete len:90 (+) comp24597_c0_seq41:1874-2143(+)